MNSRYGKPLVFLMGASISLLCLYLAFQKLNWAELLHHIRTMKLWALFIGLVLENISNFLLAKRWAILLSPLGEVSYWTAFWSLRISYFFNATLPARLGEPFRIYYINRKSKIPAAKTIGSMGADRFLDFVTLLVLLYVSVIVLEIRGTLPQTKILAIATVLATLIVIVLAKLPKSSKWKNMDRLLKFRTHIFEGMTPLLKWKVLLPTIPISFLGWIVHAAVIVSFSYGLHVPISLFKAFMVIAGVNIAIAIPSTPGYIGTFELGAITMLRYFGIPIEEAASIAILYHMVQLIPTLLIGAYGYYFHFLKLPVRTKEIEIPSSEMVAAEDTESDREKVIYH
ncbi:MAG: hypothetical protein JWQ35_1926 [Bacteriovoracaceae bacterium]|nr:hypothetical protein [Bacteriovoracaceae bacterium]